MLDLTYWQSKKFQTRGGNPDVRLLCVDGPGEYPIVGFVSEDVIRWSISGIYSVNGHETHHDLINAKTKREGWVNMYPSGSLSYIYSTESAANAGHRDGRIACCRIEWEE